MSSKIVLVITDSEDSGTSSAILNPKQNGNSDAWAAMRTFGDYFQAAAAGSKNVNVVYFDTGVSASTTGTFTGAPSNNETLSINGVTFTAKTSGATGNQFNIGASVTATAANLAAAVNASVTAGIVGTVGATSALGVVTFYSLVPGSIGLNTPITESLSNFTLAATTFSTGGTQANSQIISCGQ